MSSLKARILKEGSNWEIYLPSIFLAKEVTALWKETVHELKAQSPIQIRVFAKDLEKTDSSGMSYLLFLKTYQEEKGSKMELFGLPDHFHFLYQVATEPLTSKVSDKEVLRRGEKIGKYTVERLKGLVNLITFTGELSLSFLLSMRHPGLVRWKDAFRVGEAMGVNAFPIIAMIGFLLGLIMSFQSTIPMRRFGAEIFVANLVGLSLFRELGPLMTAFILSGRSGSSFAAEIGTMKVSEEIDALTTLGLPPVQFLIIPRLIAAMIMTPLLTVIFNFFGLMGGAVVLHSFGFPYITFINQVNIAVGFSDIMGGMVKSLFFGQIIASIGCYEGLRTSIGAGAVGESTTAAVVGSIILVSIVDGIFSVTFYYLGI